MHLIRKTNIVTRLLLSAGMLFSLACAEAQSAPLLTVEEAIELALKQNLSLQNAELSADEAAEKVGAIKASRLPKLDLRGGIKEHLTDQEYTYDRGVWGDYPIIGDIPSKDVAITTNSGSTSYLSADITQPLSQLYRLGLAVDQGEVLEEMAQYRAQGTRLELIQRVKQQYYDILRGTNDLDTTQQSIAFYTELDRVVTNYVSNGTALKYEQLDVQSRLARQRHDALLQRNTLSTNKERLNYLLGQPLNNDFTIAQLPDNSWLLPDPNTASQQAMSSRPEVVEAKLRVEAEQLGYRIKKAEYIPDLEFTAHYAQLFDVELIPDQELYVGLHARWEIYDWGRKRDELASQNLKISQAKNSLREVQERTIIQVKQSYRSWQEANDLIKVSMLDQAAKRSKLRVLMNRYRQQSALLDDVLKAETELDRANDEYNRAILGVWRAQAELEQLMGEG